jgi:hypothetical protein
MPIQTAFVQRPSATSRHHVVLNPFRPTRGPCSSRQSPGIPYMLHSVGPTNVQHTVRPPLLQCVHAVRLSTHYSLSYSVDLSYFVALGCDPFFNLFIFILVSCIYLLSPLHFLSDSPSPPPEHPQSRSRSTVDLHIPPSLTSDLSASSNNDNSISTPSRHHPPSSLSLSFFQPRNHPPPVRHPQLPPPHDPPSIARRRASTSSPPPPPRAATTMGVCVSTNADESELKKRSQMIDRALEEDSRRLRRECKILLLGTFVAAIRDPRVA